MDDDLNLSPIELAVLSLTVFVSLGGIGMVGIISTLLINYVVNWNYEKNKNQPKN